MVMVKVPWSWLWWIIWRQAGRQEGGTVCGPAPQHWQWIYLRHCIINHFNHLSLHQPALLLLWIKPLLLYRCLAKCFEDMDRAVGRIHIGTNCALLQFAKLKNKLLFSYEEISVHSRRQWVEEGGTSSFVDPAGAVYRRSIEGLHNCIGSNNQFVSEVCISWTLHWLVMIFQI